MDAFWGWGEFSEMCNSIEYKFVLYFGIIFMQSLCKIAMFVLVIKTIIFTFKEKNYWKPEYYISGFHIR